MLVEATISVVDRFLELLRFKKKLSREVFDDHVEPIFQDLAIINSDYYTMLSEISEMARKPGSSKGEIEAYLRVRRETLAPLRTKVASLADAIHAIDDETPLEKFGKSVIDYFDHSTRSSLTGYTTLLDLVSHSSFYEDDSHHDVRKLVAEVKGNIERRWKGVTVSYAEVKLHCLHSKPIFRWLRRLTSRG